MRRSVLLPLLLGAPMAQGFEIEYAQDRDPALQECDAALYVGNNAESELCFLALYETHDDVRVRADAARAMGEIQTANELFRDALEEYPEDPGVRTRWGELFRHTHQNNEAIRLYQEALEIDPEYHPAVMGLARIAAGRFEDQTREWLDDVMDLYPDHVEARLLLAWTDLEDGALESARETLEEALEIAERTDVTPLQIYALLASLDLLEGTFDSEWTAKALDINPRYGEIYATPAHFYVITRRYREAVELLRKAVEIEPDLYSAHAELGVNLLRDNLVDEAQSHLAFAYAGDPFSAQIVNTLRLIDSFDNFVVSGHGSLEEPESADPPVILRLHRDEAPVLEPYVLELINDTIDVFADRYEFDLEEPVIVELYPDHDDFAVRTSGLPGIGLLGVTFGYLVAMDSPTGRADGDFHWGTTLWHEMAHVFTLEATNHLVPRWFSEGASVHEEWSTGPLAGRHIPLSFFNAMAEDQLLPVAELDRGFIRPTYPEQVIVSYMQAGLICDYIAEAYGQERLAAMLVSFREGLDTSEALTEAIGLRPGDFDEEFANFLDRELGDVVANLEEWRAEQEKAHEAYANGDWEAAVAAATEAISLFPDYVDDGSAYLVKARAHDELEQDDLALETLDTYHALGGFNPSALGQLAEWHTERGNDAAALDVLEDMLLVVPLQQDLHAELGDRLLEDGRPRKALVEYEAFMALEPHDLASAHFRLAQAYRALEDLPRTREHLLYALEIAPHLREAQDLLLEIID